MGERNRRVSLQKIREQNGLLTFGLYALNPKTQRSPWVAIDADYENALEDLLKLQWEVRPDGVEQRSIFPELLFRTSPRLRFAKPKITL